MNVDTIKAKIAQFEAELKTLEANFHRLSGAKLAMEQLLTEFQTPQASTDAPNAG